MSSEEQKKLQKDSVFDKLDTNKDGGTASIVVSTYGFTMLTRNDP